MSQPANASPVRLTQSPPRRVLLDRLIVLILLLGVFAGWTQLSGRESLWYDETFSVYLAAQPPAELIAHTGRDTHPPGYYLLLAGWMRLANATPGPGFEFLVAWPSLAFALLSLALLYRIACDMVGERSAALTLLLGAVHPFATWYALEVRMYAVAVALALLTLLSTARYLDRPSTSLRVLIPYVAGALLGLYTLYYSAFFLLALNAVAVPWLVHKRQHPKLRMWLLAQTIVAVGYLPWLPTFLRQTFTPAVAAWREPFAGFGDFAAALGEGLAALFYALPATPPLALLGIPVLVLFAVWLEPRHSGSLLVLSTALLPLTLMLLVSISGSTIYYVRYIALSATVAPILITSVVRRISRKSIALGFLLAILVTQVLALGHTLTQPGFRADDHRQAVRQLAQLWRPGDAIVVNAGWAYTAIYTYWPATPSSTLDAVPPPLSPRRRLDGTLDITAGEMSSPIVLLAGSVDGPATLGWNLDVSDHFSVSTTDTVTALTALDGAVNRIWHYRMYDTVSDPDQLIRTWLASHATRGLQIPIPGPSFGLLERYDLVSPDSPNMPNTTISLQRDPSETVVVHHADSVIAGGTHYVRLAFGALNQPHELAASLRLIAPDGQVVAQTDQPSKEPEDSPTTSIWLALPISVATPPVPHQLQLIIYDRATLAPLAVGDGELHVDLGQITVTPATKAPPSRAYLAQFDYIRLETITLPQAPLVAEGYVDLRLVWRPQESNYRDNYSLVLRLDSTTPPIASRVWTVGVGPSYYPSSQWRAGIPVAQTIVLDLPSDLPPGEVTLTGSLQRTSDGRPIPARRGWLPFNRQSIVLGTFQAVE